MAIFNDYWYRILDDGTAEITRYTGKDSVVVIPSEVDGIKVTALGGVSFKNCNPLYEVTIPYGVTHIYGNAFGNCMWLKKVTIPDTVVYLGEKRNPAFGRSYLCKRLTTVTVYNPEKSRTFSAWIDCNSKIEKLVSLFKEGDFKLFYELRIPHWCKFSLAVDWAEEGNEFYRYCKNKITAVFPILVKNNELPLLTRAEHLGIIASRQAVKDALREYNAKSEKNLETLAFLMGYKGKYYGEDKPTDEFSLDGRLSRETLLDMGFDVVKKTGELIHYKGWDKNVVIPDCVKKIGKNVFIGCRDMVSVTIPDSVTQIGEMAFNSCSALESVTIPGSVKSIGHMAFAMCAELKKVVIEEGVEVIGQSAFYYCHTLEEVSIPDSVRRIEDTVFSACSKIVKIDISNNSDRDVGNFAFHHTNWFRFYADDFFIQNNVLIRGGRNSEEAVIPYGVTTIGSGAFSECTKLKRVVIPDSVTIIEDNAFYMCNELKSVEMSHNVTSIGNYAFLQCYKIKNIMLPDTLKSIGYWAFLACKSLESVAIPEGITKLERNLFYMCGNLKKITIPKSVTEIGTNALGTTRWLLEYPFDMVVVNGILVSYNGNKSAVSLESITGIADSALKSNERLEYVVIPEGVTSIGDMAFYNCEKLETVKFPASLKKIGVHAFTKSKWLADYPDDFVIVNGILIHYKGNKSDIVIPEGVTEICDTAFNLVVGNARIENLTIPRSMEIIYPRTKYLINRLKTLTLPEDKTELVKVCYTDKEWKKIRKVYY